MADPVDRHRHSIQGARGHRQERKQYTLAPWDRDSSACKGHKSWTRRLSPPHGRALRNTAAQVRVPFEKKIRMPTEKALSRRAMQKRQGRRKREILPFGKADIELPPKWHSRIRTIRTRNSLKKWRSALEKKRLYRRSSQPFPRRIL